MANSLLNRFLLISFTTLSIIGMSESTVAQTQRTLLNSDGTQALGSFQSDARLSSLVNNLHPSVYLTNGQVKVQEGSPTTLFTDLVSIATISEHALPVSQIEVVTIKIDDLGQLNNTINMNVFSGFDRLKYVHINSSVICSSADLFRMLKNVASQYKILITVEPQS